jgi:hypothetical protein
MGLPSRTMLCTLLGLWHSGGSGCVYPPLPPHENETEAQYKLRFESEFSARRIEAAAKREAEYFTKAESIYFARIIKSEEIRVGGSPYARRITLKPLQVLKGALPHLLVKLKDRELTSCGLGGDGPAVRGAVSNIAIVFDGVNNEGMTYRSRTYAVLAKEVQYSPLRGAWAKWKKDANFLFDQ